MENNLNNKSAQETQNKSNSTPGNNAGNASQRSMSSSNNSASTGNTNSQSAQGRSNQQATSGKDGMKNIQDTLQQYSTPIAKKISGLTTTQKVVGGSLLALGAGWLALGTKNKNKLKDKANHMTANAKHKISARKSDQSSDNRPNRSGSSSIDARVK